MGVTAKAGAEQRERGKEGDDVGLRNHVRLLVCVTHSISLRFF